MDIVTRLQQYNPAEFSQSNPSVKFVRLQWVDYSGVFHCRLVTLSKCLRLSESKRAYKLPVNCISIPLSTWPSCDVSPPQVWELHPDWSTFKLCGYRSTHASVQCFLTRTGDAVAFAMCPRAFLLNTLQEVEEVYNLTLRIGFEVEFVLLDDKHLVPQAIDKIYGFSTCAGMRGSNLDLIEEILEALEASNIPVHHLHTEDKDQLEISLEHEEPLAAIDSVMHAQEAIRTIAIRRGLKATMTPKPLLNRHLSNGLHMHLSIDQKNTILDHFLAGILNKLMVLCALGLPSYDSYHRVNGDGTGTYVGWGTENRELPIRAIGCGHWEYRAVDTTANLYLLLGTLLKAGITGINQMLPLRWLNCHIFPRDMNVQQLQDHKLEDRIPTSLKSSLHLLREDPDVRGWLGIDLTEKYLKVKDKDEKGFSEMTEEARREKFLEFY